MTTSNRTLPTHLLLLALVAALALLPGCSSFKSSSSPFRWSSASFKSSSKFSSSSSPDGDKKEKPEEGQPEEDQYEDDVKEHTAAFVGSGGDPQTLLVSLAPVAKRHGISNWEQEPESYRGIGQGLGLAKVSLGDFERYQRAVSRGDDMRESFLKEGYTSVR